MTAANSALVTTYSSIQKPLTVAVWTGASSGVGLLGAHAERATGDPAHAWFEAQLAKLPSRSPTAEAIRYGLNHWDGLERFLEDGRVEPDTNCVELAMLPVALSRKIACSHAATRVGSIGHPWLR